VQSRKQQIGGQIPWQLGSLHRLEELWINSNNLTGTIIPQSLGNLSSLRVFYAEENRFSGGIRDVLGQMTSLEELIVASNNLLGEIPASVFNLSSLTILSFGVNKLHGNLPREMGLSLPNLVHLDMAENQFSGSIPASLSNASNLVILQLQFNNFTGRMPGMESSHKLSRIYIYQNSLGGGKADDLSFFSSLPNATSLVQLFVHMLLSHNRLSGTIPISIGSLTNLGELDLSHNMLSGEIPASLGSCAKLEMLSLQSNLLQGTIPSSLSSLRSIKLLDISSNNLSGQFPKSFEGMKLLQLLNLSYNSIEGEVPSNGVFRNGSIISIVGNGKLCGGKKNAFSHKLIIKIVISTVSSVLLLAFVGSWLLIFWNKKRGKQDTVSADDSQLPLSYRDLHKATNGFSGANLIGVGSFGSVYKGLLDKTLKNIRHKNLVRILTVCSGIDDQMNDFKALVYEYLANVVHCDLKPSNVLLNEDMTGHVNDFGLARFLQPTGDPSSIGQMSSTIGIKGTIGYAPPGKRLILDTYKCITTEYGMGNEVSKQGDVYSYGVLLCEVFTGKRPTDEIFKEGLNIHTFVRTALSEKLMAQVLDPVLINELPLGQATPFDAISSSNTQETKKKKGQILEEVLISILEIGVVCSSDSPNERISIGEVVTRLVSLKNLLHDKFAQRQIGGM
ncbi:unnamed protein product, partial [Linum tenue]